MPEKLFIEGGSSLSGEINVRGSKNAATPLIAATLLTSKPCVLSNLPRIADVFKMLEILQSLGADVQFIEERKVRVEAKNIDPQKLDFDLVSKMRSSVLILGPLVARFGYLRIPHPGGCVIGSRGLETHLLGLQKMGVSVKEIGQLENGIKHSHEYEFKSDGLKGKEVILDEFSVTATENILMAAVLAKGKTVIKTAAAEPHVEELAIFLRKMGAKIKGEGTHRIEVRGVEKLDGSDHFIPYDYLEAGTFIILAVAAKGKVQINNVPVGHLDLLLSKMKRFGARMKVGKDSVAVSPGKVLQIDRITTMIHPGIPTDLQCPLGVLSTQAKGLTLIHDWLYEGRLRYLQELNKMGAEIVMCDPHRAIINGPTKLYGATLDPLDLRSGVALIIAGIIAEGTTTIKDVSHVDRGYEEIEKRLQGIGVNIMRKNV